jgi:hypothetical protein
MAEYMGRAEAHTNGVTREYSVASGVTVTSGDFVILDANGRVNLPTTAGERLLGTVEGGDTQNLDRSYGLTAVGNAGGTVKVLVNIEKDARYLQKANATIAAANVGDTLDVTAGTGTAQVIDVAKGSPTGQLIVLERGEGLRGADATYAVVSIADNQRQT